jgi:ATP-binding cassette subfamily B protein
LVSKRKNAAINCERVRDKTVLKKALSFGNMKLNKSPILMLARLIPLSTFFYFLLIIFVTLVATVGEIITISSIQPLINNITGAKSDQRLFLANFFSDFSPDSKDIFVLAIFSICIAATCRLCLIWMNIDFTNKLSEHLSRLLMKSILSKDLQFFKDQSSDEIISAFALKIGGVSSTILAFTNLTTSVLIMFGITLAVISVEISYTLQAICFMLILYLLILITLRKRIFNNGVLIANKQSQLISIAQSAIGSIRDIILNHTAEPYVHSYNEAQKKLNRASAINTFLNQSPRFVFEAVFMVGVIIIGTIYETSRSGAIFISSLAVMAVAAQRIIPLMQQSYSAVANLFASRQAMNDVISFLDFSTIYQNKVYMNNTTVIKKVALKNISFGYANSQILFRKLNLEISAGDFLVIQGVTGSGKSTLLDIILGFVQPVKGQVIINGHKQLQKGSCDFVGKVAFVPQKIFILNGTVRDNVLFNMGNNFNAYDCNDQKVIECCQLALFFDDTSPSQFLEKACGENGSKLSGGQIQRLALARALYQEPDLLVLDEFGSALDNKTLHKVIENIKLKFENKIIVCVTHSELVSKHATNSLNL